MKNETNQNDLYAEASANAKKLGENIKKAVKDIIDYAKAEDDSNKK